MNIKNWLENNKNGLILGFISGYFVLFLLSQTFIPIPFLDSVKALFTGYNLSFQELLSRAGIIFIMGTTIVGGILYNYSSYLRNKVKFSKAQVWGYTIVLASLFIIGQGTDLFSLKGIGGFIGGLVSGKAGFLGLGALLALPVFAGHAWIAAIILLGALLIFGLPFIGLGISILTNFKLILFTITGAIILITLLKGSKR